MLDLRQLQALRAVAEHGSILRAADALGWSQPTVGYHLRSLGKSVGAPVIVSTARGSSVTPVGVELLRHAVALLDRADRALDDARRFVADANSRLSVGVFPSAGARLLPSAVRALRGAGYRVTVTEAELGVLLAGLADLTLDVVTLFHLPNRPLVLPEGVSATPLRRERLVVVAPVDHPAAKRGAAALSDFRADGWVFGNSPDDPVDNALREAAESAGFTPDVTARSDDYGVVTAYVRAGFGVALVPEFALAPQLDGVAVVELADPLLERWIVLATSPAVPSTTRGILVAALRG